ncbi:MAG: hypothetical protein JO022_11880, partial [Acidobacteriaceae bacterium]|nr:hypothetical protein [Acidobacteriaceae bacterium]
YVMEGDTGESALMALAHELSHALADQNFHLDKYIKQNESDDAATARMAVTEGQASWLMSAYLHQRAGLGPDVPKAILEMMSNSIDEGPSQYPVYAQSPLYVQQSLTFPYKAGMLFQDAVFRKLGKDGFAEVFRRAPASTQQIMHPEKYLDHVDPQLPHVAELADHKQFRKLGEGTLGEFDFHVLIEQYGSKERADSLAPHLSGSQFTLWENKREGYPVLSWASQWDSPEQAQQFFDFYKEVLHKKVSKPQPGNESEHTADGRNEYGYYRVQLKGAVLESVEGLKHSVD